MKELTRMIICLLGLTLMGILFSDILKKWHLISNSLEPAWIVLPILTLFMTKEVTYSTYIKDNPKLSPKVFIILEKSFKIIMLIISIFLIISVPFIWYGAIDEAIRSSG